MPAQYHSLLFFVLLGGCPVAGCSHSGDPVPADAAAIQAFRIIIGFTGSPRPGPENPRLIAGLEQALNCRLESLHAAADAHVYICHTRENEESLSVRLDKLEQRSDIQYAELDQKRKITTP